MFAEIIQPTLMDRLLDVGGYPATWTVHKPMVKSICCLNVHEVDWDSSAAGEYNIETVIGDGCSLQAENGEYDIAFSNSVIEHVGDWSQQVAFAKEVRRVGQRLWIQTPALECPIEPHYMAPFVHWLPITLRRKILRYFTPWGWMTKPNQKKVDDTIYYTRLLSKKQMVELFPDCEIFTEKLLYIFPKSYVAYRA